MTADGMGVNCPQNFQTCDGKTWDHFHRWGLIVICCGMLYALNGCAAIQALTYRKSKEVSVLSHLTVGVPREVVLSKIGQPDHTWTTKVLEGDMFKEIKEDRYSVTIHKPSLSEALRHLILGVVTLGFYEPWGLIAEQARGSWVYILTYTEGVLRDVQLVGGGI